MLRGIDLKGMDCIIFLIIGSFLVGGTITNKTEIVLVKGRDKKGKEITKEITRTVILRGMEIAKIGEEHLVVKEKTL